MLPLTRAEACEIFIYDIAVRPDHQRKGVGRCLITALREEAAAVGVTVLFVLAETTMRTRSTSTARWVLRPRLQRRSRFS